ncbi:hypothetical protein FACS189494_07430 [Spirochaetia bacterium]|nr:hypothetical protein FACS189494_07430 [Spirochaetia bacterium]
MENPVKITENTYDGPIPLNEVLRTHRRIMSRAETMRRHGAQNNRDYDGPLPIELVRRTHERIVAMAEQMRLAPEAGLEQKPEQGLSGGETNFTPDFTPFNDDTTEADAPETEVGAPEQKQEPQPEKEQNPHKQIVNMSIRRQSLQEAQNYEEIIEKTQVEESFKSKLIGRAEMLLNQTGEHIENHTEEDQPVEELLPPAPPPACPACVCPS